MSTGTSSSSSSSSNGGQEERVSYNERLSQDTLYQDYRYLVGIYNNQYLEILRQIDDLRREAEVVRNTIDATTLDMRRRMRELTAPSRPGATMNPIMASLLVAREDEVIQTLFNGLLEGVRGGARGSHVGSAVGGGAAAGVTAATTQDWRGMTAYRPTTIPSSRQINEAVRVVRYGDLGEREAQDRCPISWTTFNPEDRVSQIIHCGHVFNTTELSRWFLTNARCPLCRHDIRDRMEVVTGGHSHYYPYPQPNNDHDGEETTQTYDVSGNLVDAEMTATINWAHGLN